MSKEFKRAIHWFRRDLRLTDNMALNDAAARSVEIIPVFQLSGWRSAHVWTGAPRQEFLCGCLESLSKNLEAIGGRLILRSGKAAEVLKELIKESGADAVFFNRDPDPFGMAAEARVRAVCQELGIACVGHKDVVLHEKDEVLTGQGTPYRVYTPYYNNWITVPKATVGPRVKSLRVPAGIKSDPLPTVAHWKLEPSGMNLLPAGERAARKRLKVALENPMQIYAAKRNEPSEDAASRIGQDLRYGLLSIREVFHRAFEHHEAASGEARKGYFTYLKQLAWRDFYMQILGHYPEVLETEFKPDWRGLPWNPGEGDAWDRWCEGRTGFPIVDAGMRQLNATGYMHNRVRMITAMFLTKDLRIHWMAGESYFLQRLLDGDIANNNGGWQWSAGTGADAAPYFRIQNPWTQTKSYDAEGAYIKQWVPELKKAIPKVLYTEPKPGFSVHSGYPAPMVMHKAEREKTLAMFKAFRKPSA